MTRINEKVDFTSNSIEVSSEVSSEMPYLIHYGDNKFAKQYLAAIKFCNSFFSKGI